MKSEKFIRLDERISEKRKMLLLLCENYARLQGEEDMARTSLDGIRDEITRLGELIDKLNRELNETRAELKKEAISCGEYSKNGGGK